MSDLISHEHIDLSQLVKDDDDVTVDESPTDDLLHADETDPKYSNTRNSGEAADQIINNVVLFGGFDSDSTTSRNSKKNDRRPSGTVVDVAAHIKLKLKLLSLEKRNQSLQLQLETTTEKLRAAHNNHDEERKEMLEEIKELNSQRVRRQEMHNAEVDQLQSQLTESQLVVNKTNEVVAHLEEKVANHLAEICELHIQLTRVATPSDGASITPVLAAATLNANSAKKMQLEAKLKSTELKSKPMLKVAMNSGSTNEDDAGWGVEISDYNMYGDSASIVSADTGIRTVSSGNELRVSPSPANRGSRLPSEVLDENKLLKKTLEENLKRLRLVEMHVCSLREDLEELTAAKNRNETETQEPIMHWINWCK